jgi:AraC family cel operon transcriptional repressor
MRRIPVPATLRQHAWIQVVRLHYRPGDSYDLHDHDFCEIFWIEHGEALHTVNGVQQRLEPGVLTIMRPSDRHEFATSAGFVMVNVTHRAEAFSGLAQRFADGFEKWPWGDAALPVQATLSPAEVERLQAAAEELAGDGSRLAAEGFLFDLLRLLRRSASAIDQPAWLERAIAGLRAPEHLAAGPGELVRLCGRSPAHVNRAVRAAHGCTATELVNRIRLEHAARRLKLSREGIAAISAGCGFASLAHFYRVFARRFGATPRAFRLGHQAVGRTVPEQLRSGVPVPVDRPRPRR